MNKEIQKLRTLGPRWRAESLLSLLPALECPRAQLLTMAGEHAVTGTPAAALVPRAPVFCFQYMAL